MMVSDYDLELEATACRSKPAVDDKDGQFEGSMQCFQLLHSKKSIMEAKNLFYNCSISKFSVLLSNNLRFCPELRTLSKAATGFVHKRGSSRDA